MLRKDEVLLAIIVSIIGTAALASETISYKYDARGRLVKVQRSGSVNNNVTANYTYDKADNRTNVNVASPNSPPP
jgi:YD repeat-containing protein